jgi:hypothetical protein
MFVTISLFSRGLTPAERIIQTVIIVVVVFLPFSYFMDRWMYRAHLRRTAATRNGQSRGGSPPR